MADPEIAKARKFLKSGQRLLLATHERPDGDALGSLLGLGWMLKRAGKEVHWLCKDGAPAVFRFLPGAEEVHTTPPAVTDLTIFVDCSDAARVGELSAPLPAAPSINIDHHATNGRFADANLVEPRAVATAEEIFDLSRPLGLPVGREAAICLLTGVVTDTLGFRTSNVNRKTLRITEALMEAGANLPDILERSMYRRSFAAARYWGAGLSHVNREGGVVWTSLSLEERRASGYPGRDDADLINILSSIEGVELAMIFVEQEGGQVKISWRSRNGADITPIAMRFGGGGHPAAAGASVEGSLEQVVREVVKVTQSWLSGKL